LQNPQRAGHPQNLNGTPKATAKLPGELVKWYHPAGQAVNCVNYGGEVSKGGHPPHPSEHYFVRRSKKTEKEIKMETSARYHAATGLFSRSLFKSLSFLLASGLLVIAVSFDCLIMAHYWRLLGKHIVFWLGLVMVGLISYWIRSILLHNDIHKLYQGDGVTAASANSSLDVVIGAAEKMFYAGLYFTFFLSAALLAQILAILSKQ
jgi:hypothetical protein